MTRLPIPKSGQLAVVIDASPDQMIDLTAVLALRGPVHVVIGGNRFDAHRLARAVRRHTHQMQPALDRVHLARGFTCYQVAALLADIGTGVGEAPPLLVVDLLATFADEAATAAESLRLLRVAVGHLQQTAAQTPVLVSLRQPPQPDRTGLLTTVTAAADVVIDLPSSPAKRKP